MAEPSPAPPERAHYAGFWVRFLAACIDLLLFVPVYLAFRYAFDLFARHGTGVADASMDYASVVVPGGAYQWWFEGVFDVASLLLYAWFMASRWQGSPGMHLLKFHVCDQHGRRIGFTRALMWGITAVLGWLICFAGILYMQKDINAVKDMLTSCREQNIEISDCIAEIEKAIGIPYASFMQLAVAAVVLTLFLYLVWALSIALPKDKTGFHNLICGTRFVRGRPQA